MTLTEFKEKSKRTCASLGNEKLDLSHMILGMMSEFSELTDAIKNKDVVNIGEEIADKFFYLVNYATFRNIEIESDFNITQTEEDDLEGLMYNMSLLSDYVKKYVAYNKEINRELEEKALIMIVANLYNTASYFGLEVHKILQNNVDKLLVRFPISEGFTTDRANNRNLSEERIKLEQ